MNCTGKRCIMQFDKVDPATCKCVSYCPQATPPKYGIGRLTTYDELVKWLKELCYNCALWNGYKCCLKGECNAQTRLEAADAIEELSKLADAIPHVCECCVGCEMEKKNGGCDYSFILSPKRATQYLIKPRWIPVTERLPTEDDYMPCYENYDGAVLWYTNSGVMGLGWYYDSTGNWSDTENCFPPGKVTHWMPIPKPPKEENCFEETEESE